MPQNDAHQEEAPMQFGDDRQTEGPDDPRQYVRVAVDLPFNPKLMAMDNLAEAIAAYVVSLCYSGSSFTDGHFPLAAVQRLAGVSDATIKSLITEGLWHDEDSTCSRCMTPRRGHGYVHDYLRHQRSAKLARELASKRAEAGRAGAQKRWGAVQAKKDAAAARAAAKGQPADYREDVEKICEYLAKLMTKNHPKGKQPTITKAWKDAARKLIDVDKHAPSEICKVILWTQKHHFWHQNILSMGKLREKYDDMLIKMKAEGDAPARPGGRAPVAGQGEINFEGQDQAFDEQFGGNGE